MKWTPERKAGIGYVLPVLAVAAVWYILLFTSNPPNPNYREMLETWFFQVPERRFFWWLALLPAVCLALALAYLSPLAEQKWAAVVLCAAGIAAAVATWLMFDASIAIFVTLPLLFSVPRAKWHLTTRLSGP